MVVFGGVTPLPYYLVVTYSSNTGARECVIFILPSLYVMKVG